LESLFNIELYFTQKILQADKLFYLVDDELHHAVKVMRSKIGDKIFATDGKGKIFEGNIVDINKDFLEASITEIYSYQNLLGNIKIFIPNLKNPDRLKFAIEKCVELGITDIFIFNSERTFNKSVHPERLEKILISAMKQSLRAFLPKINFIQSIKSLQKENGVCIVFDQKAEMNLIDYRFDQNTNYHLIFGPEGSLTDEEVKSLAPDFLLSLGKNRLRSETAVIKAVSVISSFMN
jgi:16S rRNA (uracil1498-N3)-methyltransferase